MIDIPKADPTERLSVTIRKSQRQALDAIKTEQGHDSRSRVMQEAIDFYLERRHGERWMTNWLPHAIRDMNEKIAVLRSTIDEEEQVA